LKKRFIELARYRKS